MIEIREARGADEQALSSIDQATWSPAVTPAPPSPSDEPFFQNGRPPEDVLVAVDGGEVVGLLLLQPAFPLEASRHVQEIKGLAVDPSRTREGIGRALLQAAADRARTQGARRLTLRVLSTNDAALALYGSFGFETEGVLRGEFFLDGKYVDDVLMAVDLTAEASSA